VTLITMHNTKGLEFDRVFITGLEEGLFPGRAQESDDDLEEERRIFYVSVTRARQELYLLSAKRRMIWGRTNFQLPVGSSTKSPPACSPSKVRAQVQDSSEAGGTLVQMIPRPKDTWDMAVLEKSGRGCRSATARSNGRAAEEKKGCRPT
jgi:hypothetical protein